LTPSPSDKHALRLEGLARRDALDGAWREDASRQIMQHVLAVPDLAPDQAGRAVIAGYWPMRSEVDTRALLSALAERGFTLALPLVVDPHLRFLRWRPGEKLLRGAFAVEAPAPDAEELQPDILLMPLARFDAACNRIGYGKGHYDRAIARLTQEKPVRTIGLAFAVQSAEKIPVEAHDVRLDLIVTEAGIIR
jgi:5-formyltetrahydrofolate cyclo-ligase